MTEVLPETEIKPIEMEIVAAYDDACDASEVSDLLAETKEEFDHNTYQHDEVGLNPIEDIEILEKILKKQNHGCCDTAVEDSLKRMKIPEEVIERILCKADKALCTCEATDWMQNATGYNYGGTDESIATLRDDAKSVNESNVESVVMGKGESVADDAKTEAETDLDTSAETEDVDIADESNLDILSETDDAIQGTSVADEIKTDTSVKDESPTLPAAEDAMQASELAEENYVDTSVSKEEAVTVEEVAVEEVPVEEVPVEAGEGAVATTVAGGGAAEAPKVVDESHVDTPLSQEEENFPFDELDEVKLTDESNLDAPLVSGENVSVVSVDAPRGVSDSMMEQDDYESGFECVLALSRKEKTSAEKEEVIAYSPKKLRKLSRLSAKISKKILKQSSKMSSKLSKIMSGKSKKVEEELNEYTSSEEIVQTDLDVITPKETPADEIPGEEISAKESPVDDTPPAVDEISVDEISF